MRFLCVLVPFLFGFFIEMLLGILFIIVRSIDVN